MSHATTTPVPARAAAGRLRRQRRPARRRRQRTARQGVTDVIAKDVGFSPASIQVPAGTEVTWSFQEGPVPHDVQGDGWGSGDPQRSGTFRHSFDRPDTYGYTCTVHPRMRGRVVVTAKS